LQFGGLDKATSPNDGGCHNWHWHNVQFADDLFHPNPIGMELISFTKLSLAPQNTHKFV
jgi:hypothetical protein